MVKREKSNYMIQSVSHAIDVLEELCRAGGEIGVTELSKRLKLHKNNVFRLLATLELRGYVEQNSETEDYRLGVKSLELGQAYLTQSTLVARAVPVLKRLTKKVGETVSLATLQNTTVQFPVSFEAKTPVKVSPRVATSFSAKVNGAGKLLLAQLPDSTLDEILAGATAQDQSFKAQIPELRRNGFTSDKATIEPDVFSASALVTGVNNSVVGAIEVLAPQYRAKQEDIIAAVQASAEELSAALGGGRRAGLSASMEKEVSSGTGATAR